jgi:hypothetical protein
MGEKFALLEDIEDRLRFLPGYIDSDLLHRFDHKRIQLPGLETSTFGREKFAAEVIEPRLRHLAACAVMHADEKDVRFHSKIIPALLEDGNETSIGHDFLTDRAQRKINEGLHQTGGFAVRIKESRPRVRITFVLHALD